MNFSVVWRDSALDKLADLYVATSEDERDRMARGIESLNRRLADDPLNVGESRDGTFRIVFPPLLLVTFFVDEPRALVQVYGIARYGH